MNIRSGNLRHRLQFQEPTQERNSVGEVIESYSTYMTVWGSLMAAKGTETLEANTPQGTQSYTIKIRYNSDVSLTDQIVFGSRIFEINSIDNYAERNVFLMLQCSEIL